MQIFNVQLKTGTKASLVYRTVLTYRYQTNRDNGKLAFMVACFLSDDTVQLLYSRRPPRLPVGLLTVPSCWSNWTKAEAYKLKKNPSKLPKHPIHANSDITQLYLAQIRIRASRAHGTQYEPWWHLRELFMKDSHAVTRRESCLCEKLISNHAQCRDNPNRQIIDQTNDLS